MKLKKYTCHVWKAEFWFAIGSNPKSFERFIKKEFDYDTSLNCCQGKLIELTSQTSYPVYLIWTRNKDDYAALAHEALHAVNYLFDVRDYKPDLKNDEAQTYLLEWVIDSALGKRTHR